MKASDFFIKASDILFITTGADMKKTDAGYQKKVFPIKTSDVLIKTSDVFCPKTDADMKKKVFNCSKKVFVTKYPVFPSTHLMLRAQKPMRT